MEIVSDHRKHNEAGLSDLRVNEGLLRATAKEPCECFLVISSSNPLSIDSVTEDIEAELLPGWNGSIHPGHYGLQIVAEKAGPFSIEILTSFPPADEIKTPPDVIEGWQAEMKLRASRPPKGAKAFREWQHGYRKRFAAALMNGGLPEVNCKGWERKTENDCKDFSLRSYSFESRPGRHTEALLSIPKTGEANFPLLLAIHGHEAEWGKADVGAFMMGHNDDFCAYFAERGWAVLQPATMDHSLHDPDWTLQGEWTFDCLTALDLALRKDVIDQKRVAVCGLSTGAHLAMNVLALEPRVRAGVVGCVLSHWRHYDRFRFPPHCDCGIREQLSATLEQCDWAALAAPKAVQFQHGKLDYYFCPGAHSDLLQLNSTTGILPESEWETVTTELVRAYGHVAAANEVDFHIHDGPHSVNNEAAFDWLTKALG